MRILVYTSLFPNAHDANHGVFVFQRASHLAKRGHNVEVVAPIPYVPVWLQVGRWQHFAGIPREEQIANLRVRHPRYLLLPKVSFPLHALLMALGSRRLVRRLHSLSPFDIVDAHYVYPDGLAGVLLARDLHVPVVVSARGSDLTLFPSFRLIRPQIRWALRQASAGVAVSSSLRREMLANGLAASKCNVIGNGVDLERFHPIPRIEARQRLQIPPSAAVIVSVGGLNPVKGFDRLIEAFSRLRSVGLDSHLYIIGKGPERDRLEGLVQRSALQGRVTLVGEVPNTELKYWFSAADLSVLVSFREGWPNVLLESMACGTPVLATRAGGIPEVIASSDVGMLVEESISSIAEGLRAALEKNWDRGLIAKHAQRRTWDAVANEAEQVLEAVSKRGKSTQSEIAAGVDG